MRESNSPAAVSASREAREQARLKSDLKRITGLKVIGWQRGHSSLMGGYELMRGAGVVVCQVRVRSLTEDSKDTVLRDVASLNLEMFIEELVAAVVESKLKASDILAAVRHERPGRTHPRIVGIQREHDVTLACCMRGCCCLCGCRSRCAPRCMRGTRPSRRASSRR